MLCVQSYLQPDLLFLVLSRAIQALILPVLYFKNIRWGLTFCHFRRPKFTVMHHKVATPPALHFRGGGALKGFLWRADWLRSVRLTSIVSASRAVRCTSTATIMVPGSRKWAKSYRQIRYFTHAPISFQVRGRHFCNYFLSPCLSVGTGAVSKKCGNSAEC